MDSKMKKKLSRNTREGLKMSLNIISGNGSDVIEGIAGQRFSCESSININVTSCSNPGAPDLQNNSEFEELLATSHNLSSNSGNDFDVTDQVRVMQPGYFCYFGIGTTLRNLFTKFSYTPLENSIIELGVNIDGLPISKSVKSTFYPILCNIKSIEIFKTHILLIGLYHGADKPMDSNDLLQEFVEESISLYNNGIILNGIICKIRIVMLTCDLPAKSYVLKTKGHMGYFSCSKCKQEGDHVERVLCFPETSFIKRTDDDFRRQTQSEHHIGCSILTKLPQFNMIRDAPLDYMHLICLGVVKRILAGKKHGLIFGKPPYKLPSRDINNISERLKIMSKFIPMEFSRKTRPITECRLYKASEFRFFLLYAAPVVLRGIVKKAIYNNILTLHLATSILISREFHCHSDYLKYANDLMLHFVQTSLKLYGADFVAHNVHCLLHIADDVKYFGELDNFSAFPYENYMQKLKNILRKHHKPLQQVIRRSMETEFLNSMGNIGSNEITPYCTQEHFDGPTIIGCNKQFKAIKLSNCTIKLNRADSVVQLKTMEIVRVFNICTTEDDIKIVGKEFIDKQELYLQPCSSSIFHIYECQQLKPTFSSWSINEINHKVVLLPHKNGFAAFPMLH
ncbi:uncharacterized protein LOC116159899 isoform X1 [Photinus pyralis]|nr:uncharacterized protein LOC116159899 isoform X1 [Photinus pyralis]